MKEIAFFLNKSHFILKRQNKYFYLLLLIFFFFFVIYHVLIIMSYCYTYLFIVSYHF
jgi:hypothetical protein